MSVLLHRLLLTAERERLKVRSRRFNDSVARKHHIIHDEILGYACSSAALESEVVIAATAVLILHGNVLGYARVQFLSISVMTLGNMTAMRF